MISILRALGDSHRQNILKLLAGQEMAACEIIQAVGLSQPAIAHHLKILKQAELINSQKEGKNVFYTLNKEGFNEFLNLMKTFMEDISCFSSCTAKPSLLRQNPDLCKELGCEPAVCQTDLSKTR